MKKRKVSDKVILEYIENYGDGTRPTVRSQCEHFNVCPFISCRYHLFLDVDHNGRIIRNFPGKEPYELEATCALKVAEEKTGIRNTRKMSLGDIVMYTGLTKEGIRQVEKRAKAKIALDPIYQDFSDYRTHYPEKSLDPDKTNYEILGDLEIEKIYMDLNQTEEDQEYVNDMNLY